ncbi:MAG: FAD/NAD(P)-binding protein [Nocardioides sp.]|uniref:FAD/NAD(P)-binding protein n=1 Tax=Nocardioides sp. TaxID=35761 RepID=UPI0039E60F26
MRQTVAIVGGGASGVLAATNLLARCSDAELSVVIFEASGIVGRGIAYGTTDQRHLLNVRARHMSAFPDRPGDLLDWSLRTGRNQDPQGFLSRADFAIYLQDRLGEVADDRLQIRAGRVLDVVRREADGFDVATARTTTRADHVILAYGNLAPRPLAVDGEPLPDAAWLFDNPWDLGRLRRLPADAHVLIVGTGLTSIDTAITLLEEGPNRHVTMVSRNGVLPKAHAGQQHTAWVTKVPEGPLTADLLAETMVAEIEAARAVDVSWRAVVDGIRPATNDLWRRLPHEERVRFLEVHRREWEIRRHRMAREIADRVDRYRREGRLSIRPGTLVAVSDAATVADVVLAPGEAPQHFHAVVNCTGPLTDVTGSDDPLLHALLRRGLIAPDPLRLGILSTDDGELLDASGEVVEGLYAVGPPRKGTLWESTAIPEIRTQAAQIAARIAG